MHVYQTTSFQKYTPLELDEAVYLNNLKSLDATVFFVQFCFLSPVQV